jgi:phosphatidyl-myo-inositol alpha-mannosyltransferase
VRIAVVHPFAWPYVRRGGERYADELVRYLARNGHQVTMISGDPGTTASGVRHVRLRNPSIAPLARRGIGPVETFGVRALPALLSRAFDVVHAFTPTAALAARAVRQRTVYTVLGLPTPEVFEGRPRHRALLERAVRRADEVTVLSAAAADAVIGSTRRTPVVLAPGVRTDEFRADLSPRTGPPRVLFSSALDQPQKGLDVLVRAFSLVLRTHPDARLVLSGPGSADWALAHADPETRSSTDILGPGASEDVPRRYRSATVTVLPSRHEAFGLVLVESLASGTPVVGTPEGGASDIIDASVGRLAPYGDVDALATAIIETIAAAGDAGMRARCAAHAKRWDWNGSIGPQHEDVYRSVARPRLGR